MKLALPFMIIQMLLVGGKIATLKRKIFEENYGDIATPMKSKAFKDKLNFLFHMASSSSDISIHSLASFGSTIKSMLLMKLLKSAGDTSNVEHDRNMLMSHCNDVVSAEVPSMLRKIAKAIEDKATFAEMSDEEALQMLRSEKGNAAELFAEFTKRHGHRGYREMDPLQMPWRANPIPCVQVIKVIKTFITFKWYIPIIIVFAQKWHRSGRKRRETNRASDGWNKDPTKLVQEISYSTLAFARVQKWSGIPRKLKVTNGEAAG